MSSVASPVSSSESSGVATVSSGGRRERKKQQTRRALQAAAVRLVGERGFDHVTVEQLADAADVSTRTFFNYFASKEQALIGHNPEDDVRLGEALAARPAGEPPLRSLRAVLGDLLARVGEERDQWLPTRVLVRSLVRTDPRLLSAWVAAWTSFEQALVAGVASRLGADPERDLYPALVVSAAVAATRVAVLRWDGSDPTRLRALLDEAFDGLEHGLIAPALTTGGS